MSLSGNVLALLLLHAGCALAGPEIVITVGKTPVVAETAVTPQAREKGLMGRKSLAKNHGMLFVFQKPDYYRMWMRDTSIPLSVAFLDEKGRVINIEDMPPLSLELHASAEQALYALEMGRGWFSAHHVGTGSLVIMPSLRAVEEPASDSIRSVSP